MFFSGKTDIGKKRNNNQDCFDITELSSGAMLLTVCDGMGGANGGNIASGIACKVFCDCIKEGFSDDKGADADLIRSAVAKANTAVYETASSDPALKGMGTTLVSALIRDDGSVTVVNVGDSRLYLLSGDQIRQVTRDHSYVQYLVDMGQITVSEAKTASIRNIIIRSIGNEAETTPDLFDLKCESGAALLLCTDGLTNCVTNEIIAQTVSSLVPEDIDGCTERLVELANDGGGTDNITVVLASF